MTTETGQQISPNSDGAAVVSVAFPAAIPGLYDYHIPDSLKGKIVPGTPVLVEVKKRQTWGVAVQIKSASQFPELKDVLEIKSGHWADESQSLVKLYEWISSYYQCELGRVFRPLVRKGLIKTNAKTVMVYSVVNYDSGLLKPAYKQILDTLSTFKDFTPADIERKTGIKSSSIQYLLKKGFLKKQPVTILREADELKFTLQSEPNNLSEEQNASVQAMLTALHNPQKPFLLHGITGSGKTHVYIELASRVLKQGKGVIILVPEISLTPQTIQRFRNALGDVIAVIHSHMSDGERRDSLQELVTGNRKMVIGVRSAILAPIPNVGLIIVDEEHDASYKQSDLDPRYNARDVAVMRGHFQHALVVLGSATPSLESYYNALHGKYNLLKLSCRYGAATLPKVQIVDMASEQKNNNWTPFSNYLVNRMQECFDTGRQVILLLNRRGFSTVLLCKDCGNVTVCPNCSVSLRYHRSDGLVKCHLCGHEQAAQNVCPVCRGEKIKYQGTGIQKVEEMLRERFPQIRILRMDQDSTRKKGAHISILRDFEEQKAEVLLGTQMVAKGLNFPNVALVGVIQADTGLHFPDFRASERTFQLLTQVAGRAGRADSLGEVIIQTYSPTETAIIAASNHDYESFYNAEILLRQELSYPPVGKLARIVVEGSNEELVRSSIENAVAYLEKNGGMDLKILGPTPAVLEKIANQYRYTCLLKTQYPRKLNLLLTGLRKKISKPVKNLKFVTDVDPVNML
ncbi:MAG: primosomal protein N' [Fibrobacter sp.]|nr:primosomal protein N' [Fibrobacter sp.]